MKSYAILFLVALTIFGKAGEVVACDLRNKVTQGTEFYHAIMAKGFNLREYDEQFPKGPASLFRDLETALHAASTVLKNNPPRGIGYSILVRKYEMSRTERRIRCPTQEEFYQFILSYNHNKIIDRNLRRFRYVALGASFCGGLFKANQTHKFLIYEITKNLRGKREVNFCIPVEFLKYREFSLWSQEVNHQDKSVVVTGRLPHDRKVRQYILENGELRRNEDYGKR